MMSQSMLESVHLFWLDSHLLMSSVVSLYNQVFIFWLSPAQTGLNTAIAELADRLTDIRRSSRCNLNNRP